MISGFLKLKYALFSYMPNPEFEDEVDGLESTEGNVGSDTQSTRTENLTCGCFLPVTI